MKDALSHPMVSIIIPTRNSQGSIESCLRSIKQQTYSNIEVIIVDNYSKDQTSKIAERFGAEVLLMDSERSAARNYGVANAKAELVFFLDSDMQLTPTVVEECVSACLESNADAVIIPETSVARNKLGEYRRLEKELFEWGDAFFEIPRFFKKNIFYQIGGFDETLVFGESTEFNLRMRRANHKILRIRATVLHDEGAISWRKFVLEEYYYGKTLPYLLKKDFSAFARGHPPVPTRLLSKRNMRLILKYPSLSLTLAMVEVVKYLSFCIGLLYYLIQ